MKTRRQGTLKADNQHLDTELHRISPYPQHRSKLITPLYTEVTLLHTHVTRYETEGIHSERHREEF